MLREILRTRRPPSGAITATLVVCALCAPARVRAQDRFLGKEDIILLGLGLTAQPDHQVVPKDVATIVSTFLAAGTQPGTLPPFAPDAIVKATLRGPSAPAGLDLTAAPNAPFNIPPLGVPGIHTLENIRLESGGQVLMQSVPDSVTIEVIDKLLVTQVTSRPMTAQEIRDKGIVFDKTNFQAYNFTAAFAVQDVPVNISFPVVLPTLKGAQDVSLSAADLAAIPPPTLPQLKTIIPDTLKLQTVVPNLQVVGFTLSVPDIQGNALFVPPIPGVVVIPGDIAFLNQFFTVKLLVGNVAPAGSNLVVDNLTAEIFLPAGNDTVVGSDDDPLRMARTAAGVSPSVQPVVQPGADGVLGTGDDIASIGPGETASAEYLVEGRREGSHTVEFNITGTLHGLPAGPVQVTGRAAGSVAVRNPTFTLTFTHPDTVSAGEPYTVDVTVTNTSTSPANFVSVDLFSQNVTGATVVGDASRQIDSIPAGDSATVSFDLIARVTGKVTAATLDADTNIRGKFQLKTGVTGELGVPVSPDTLVLPSEAGGLPAALRSAALGLLGKAWAVATSPPAALPPDITRFSKQIVIDRAVEVAEAGMRVSLHEPVGDSAAQLAMDFIGSDYARLPALHPDPTDLQFTQNDFRAFDELRRKSVRGDVFAAAVAAVLAPDLAASGAAQFHQAFAAKTAYRPAQLSVLVQSGGGPLPFTVSLVDSQGRQLGGVDTTGKVIKQIPFGDVLPFVDSNGATTATLLVIAAPDPGEFHVRFDPRSDMTANNPFVVSIVAPDGTGGLRQVIYDSVTGQSTPASPFTSADTYRVLLDLPTIQPPAGAANPVVAAVVPPPPQVLGAVQQANADMVAIAGCSSAVQVGRIIALLFNQEVTPAAVQDGAAAVDITRYSIDNNAVVSVALQPGHRVVFLGLRDPVGPNVARNLTISGVTDAQGHSMATQTVPIEMTVTDIASVVSGQVLSADGSPIPFADVRLFIGTTCGVRVGVSEKLADQQGRYSFDRATNGDLPDRVTAVDPRSGDSRAIDFTAQRNGQHLNIDIVMLGRGAYQGVARDVNGKALPGSSVRVTSLTDQSSYGAITDDSGAFTISRIPVGNILVEAVNPKANARGTLAELIPVSGATVTHDITLFDVSSPTIVVKYGAVSGHVLRADGASAVTDVPVVAYYQSGSQTGVSCPGNPPPAECAIAVVRTDSTGAFLFDRISAGQIRVSTFDQATFQQGEVRLTLPADGAASANVLLGQGLGTVNGTVLDANGIPVANARVGGGLSLTTTDASGHFTLTDVPVGKRDIVAVSDQLATKGTSTIDIVQDGQVVSVTVVLESIAAIAGTVFQADGVTPVPNNRVYLFYCPNGDCSHITVNATAVTDSGGHYSFARVSVKPPENALAYGLSAFRSDFSDGNVKTIVLKFNNQVLQSDIVFRGGGGRVTGTVLDADGTTPLRANVGVSGARVLVAGGTVGFGFQNVSNFQIEQTDITSGVFGFDNIFVGPFTVTAVGQFSPDPISVSGSIPAPGATVDVPIRLQATSKIVGTVFQPDGVTPVGRNIVVHYKSSEFKTVCASGNALIIGSITINPGECGDVPQGIQDETVITDDQGHFELPLVNAGRFTLTVEDQTTGRSGQIVATIQPGQTGDFAVRLLGLSTLTIHVLGSDAKTAIPGARVEVTQIAYPKKTIATVADATGTLVLSGGDAFSEGDLVITATDLRNGFAGRASGRVTTDGDNVSINVYLFNAAGAVFGTVFKADGVTRVPNAEVVIRNASGPLAFGVTDANGTYRQELIPIGDFAIEVFEAATARRAFGSGRIDLDRQEVPVDLTEVGRGLVTGTALAAGTLAPLVNWQVFLFQISPSGQQVVLQTASALDGTFAFPGVAVGAFRIAVNKAPTIFGTPFGYVETTSSLQSEGQRIDVPVVVQVNEQHFGRVEGVVVNPNGTPAANVSIEVCSNGSCDPAAGGIHYGTVSADDGSFGIDHVITGRFHVQASSQTSQNAASADGELLFQDDVAHLTLTLVGLSQVQGTVVFGNGSPAPNVQVTLTGRPSSGCGGAAGGACTAFTDANGAFTFINVPAQTFEVRAVDLVNGISGAVGGALNPGELKTVRVLLQATSAVSGRVLHANGAPAAGITAELAATGSVAAVDLFQVSGGDGAFAFPVVPPGAYTLTLQDPIGPGLARRFLQVTTGGALGDIALDEAPPSVASTAPAASSTGVPLGTTVRVVFSEPLDPITVTHATVDVVGPSGSVLGTLQLVDGDTTALFTPISPLTQETRYSVVISGVADVIGKTAARTTFSFTTVDLTPPTIAELTPPAGGSGVASASVIRVKFSEPIAPAAYRGPPIVLKQGATLVPGTIDYLFGNTVVVLTPAAPLIESSEYHVDVAAATDLAGNAQPQPTSYTFTTTDRTPPQVTALHAAGDGTVIENGTTQIVADVGTDHDVAVVDFFINDQPSFAARSTPFTLSLQATASLGKPGDRIKVSALATDTSGNRSVAPAVVLVPIVADQPPVVTISSPKGGTAFKTGDRVTVTVHATDDLGTTQIGYRAATGKPQDAATVAVVPASVDRTETFAFSVPADAVPGSPLAITATAIDTKGQAAAPASIAITVLDNTPPTVTITGTTTGTRVAAGQQTSAVVSAQDLGGVASITFSAGGVVLSTVTRNIAPAQKSVVTTFPITIPASARPGDTLTLDATATDAAGNTASAARILLPVADLTPPVVTLQTANGTLDLVPGTTANLVAHVEDESAVTTVTLEGQGAFNVSQAHQISPPSNSADVTLPVSVPANAAEGASLSVFATAVDVFGNVSAPATLTLTVRSQNGIALPPSLLMAAGDSADLSVQLTSPAPAGGLRVDLTSADQTLATVSGSVVFAAGETAKTATVLASRGGTVIITASVNGVPRASTNVTVRGGIVSGTIFDPEFHAVAGAEIAVASGNDTPITTISGSDGRYLVEDVGARGSVTFTVKANDPVTHRIGLAHGQLNTVNGFAHVNIVLLSAASIGGTVRQADGQTKVGAGVRVEIAASNDPLFTPLDVTFTDANGAYSFPLVSTGSYVMTASDVNGNRGRTGAVAVSASGQQADAPIAFIGRGSVLATVRDGFNNPQANVPVTFTATSVFGDATPITTSTGPDGAVRFDGVFVGTFTVQARDPITNLAGTTSGQVTANGQSIAVDVRLAQWANLKGTIFRYGGTTPAPNARVSLTVTSGLGTTYFATISDTNGAYEFLALPLGQFRLDVRIQETHEIGIASGTLPTHAQTVTQDVTFYGQGSMLVTVKDTTGAVVPGALVIGSSTNLEVVDPFTGTTDANGQVLIEHVLAATVTVDATRNYVAARVVTTLAPGELKPIAIQLQATASIVGTVFLPDGQTPASGGKVTVMPGGTGPATIGSDGRYRLDGLTCCLETLTAYDDQQRRRAVVRNVPVNSATQSLYTVDVTFNGFGTVTGRVLNPDGSSASNAFVYVRNPDPDIGNLFGVQTDAAGFYRVEQVPVGSISVTVPDLQLRGLYGEAAGTLVRDGATLTLDILLVNNAVSLPVTKTDANFFPFDVQKDGSVGAGYNVFSSFGTGRGAFGLDIVRDGVPNRFAGASFGTTQANGHEVVVSQNNLAGLNVTRKLLVSQSYFARAIEVLTNPTATPITVDVRVTHSLITGSTLATSSGDATLDVSDPANPDRWIVLTTGPDGDPFSPFFTSNRYPQLGFVFDGGGAGSRVSAVTEPSFANNQTLAYTWSGVTIQPGQTVAFMHFGVQQYSRAAAQASTERLVQLPPEALVSLSPVDIAAIQNFAVPADGTSPLAPLPLLDGSVSGHVFEADGSTLVPDGQANIRFRSNNIFFGRTYTTNSLQGVFSVGPSGDAAHRLSAVTVPRDSFTVDATHPLTQVVSAATTASFPSGATSVTADVVFSNTAMIRGLVRRTSGAVVPGAQVNTSFASASGTISATTVAAADGSYVAGGVPAGAATVTASIQHPQSANGVFRLTGTTLATVSAGQTLTRDLIIQPTGTVVGTVRSATGAVVVNAPVDVTGVDPSSQTTVLEARTDTAGQYRIVDVPLGSFDMRAIDPSNGFAAKSPVVVSQDQTSTVDFTLLAVGTVQLTATYTNGQPAPNATVEVLRPAAGRTFSSAGVTNANGQLTIPNVPAGAFVVRVHRPGHFQTISDVAGTMTSSGQALPMTVTLPPFGNVSVQVNATSGGGVANVQVTAASQDGGGSGVTDGNGRVLFQDLSGVGPILVRAYDPQTFRFRDASTSIAAEGETASVTLVLNAIGTVSGHVTRTDGSPSANGFVTLYGSSENFFAVASTDAAGAFSFANVPSGPIRLVAQDVTVSRAGSFVGVVGQDATVVADMQLTQVQLPLLDANLLTDANGYRYGLQSSGIVYPGSGFDALESLPLLAVGPVADTFTNNYFTGDLVASIEQGGRQYSIQNFNGSGGNFGNANLVPQPLNGLKVTRKAYVNPSGYFVRLLDVFENPTAQPISVHVDLSGSLNGTRIAKTTSGDDQFSAGDQWVIVDTPAFPTVSAGAFVFEGVDGTIVPSVATASTNFNGHPFLDVAWDAMTVPAGGRAIVMHFQTQGTDAVAVEAAARRLAQLPPEALVGMSAADRAAVQNFHVPADDTTLPAPFALIGGRVLAADGVTPVAGAQVLVTGNASPIFKPTISVASDGSGRYAASTLAAGPVTVQAQEPATGALSPVVLLASDGQTPLAQDVIFSTLGGIAGAVTYASGAPAAGGTVYISGGSPAVSLTLTLGASGTFVAPVLTPGVYSVQVFAANRFIATTINVVAGQIARADIRFPAQASVRVTVTDSGGAPVRFATVNISTSENGGFAFAGSTDASGVVTIPVVPEGVFTLQVLGADGATVVATQSGAVTAASDGQIIDVAIRTALGTVTGHVFAGDGATPLPGIHLELYPAGSGTLLNSTTTDAAGSYEFDSVADPTGQGVTVRAYAPRGGATYDHSGTFAAGRLTLDFTLPLSVVTGTLTYVDGVTPVVRGSVTVAQETASGAIQTFSGSADLTGHYSITGVGAGAFEVRGESFEGGLIGGATGSLATALSAASVDVHLGPSGTVAGTVRDAAGQVVKQADVYLASNGSETNRTRYVSSSFFDGSFTFAHIPVGAFSVEACFFTTMYSCGAATGSVHADGDHVSVTVTLAASGTVSGTVFAADGVTPLPGAYVSIAAGTDGPAGSFGQTVLADPAGHYSQTVTSGLVTATAYTPNPFAVIGVAHGTLTAGGALTLNVIQGTATRCDQTLLSATGFNYAIGCQGGLSQGGAADGSTGSAYVTAYALRVDGSSPSSLAAAQTELNGRQRVYGPVPLAGVMATRKVFVPATGGFARFLDTIANPTASPVTVDVQIDSTLAGAVHVVIDASATSNTYAVTQADGLTPNGAVTGPPPALAHVFGGIGASLSASSVFQSLIGSSHYTWTVTIPAGQSITLMHFAVQTRPSDTTGADAQARALANLTDPDAVTGMTPTEKAQVVNFKIQ